MATAPSPLKLAPQMTPTLRAGAIRQAASSGRHSFQHQSRRGFSNFTSSTSTKLFPSSHIAISAATVGAGAGYCLFNRASLCPVEAESPPPHAQLPATSLPKTTAEAECRATESTAHTQEEYQQIYNTIAQKLIDEDDYDDGSYAPILLRLGWHQSGTYDKATNTGGSNGATMRFAAESSHGPNKGLVNAREFLEPIKQEYPWITYSDLWTLGAVCAVQEMQGPLVPWRPGRSDRDESFCTPDGRLPLGANGADHLREVFNRMGFDADADIVALSGAHAVGRCHVDRSGWEGPWTFSPTTFTNSYFRNLVEEHWRVRQWEGKRQFQDEGTKSLMMLPTDMALVEDPAFRVTVERYARSEDEFFKDFSRVMVQLLEQGVPWREGQEGRMVFERLEDQE